MAGRGKNVAHLKRMFVEEEETRRRSGYYDDDDENSQDGKQI